MSDVSENGVKYSYFCYQECFKRNWSKHKTLRPPKNVSGLYNPFTSYSFRGTVRPVDPLSQTSLVSKPIKSPDWAVAGILKGGRRLSGTKIDILDAKGQEAGGRSTD